MVGQFVMLAIVTVSLLGSPPHVCKLGEGSANLNHPLNYCPIHQSYSTLRVGHHLLLVCTSCLWISRVFDVNWKMVFLGFCNGVCWMCMFWIYCHLWRNSCMMRICSVVCLSGSGMCSSFCGMMSCSVRVSEKI